ncbi:MAG: hypothetical protein ACOH2V_11905 [Candidatus Saccharimonadaceae bacterium]
MKKLLFTLFVVFSISLVFNLTAQNKKKAIGVWKYEVAQAPYGYDKGTLEIKDHKNEFSGVIKFNSGNSVELQKISMSNDTLRANVFVDSENVSIVAKISNSKMEGFVNTSMGNMSLKADKVVENKN